MSLENTVMQQLKVAMKEKDEVALRTLRAIKAAILQAKTASGAKSEISEDDELKMLQKMVKQRKDSLDIFNQQNRQDLAEKEAQELTILETFLPKPLSEDELNMAVADIIQQQKASSMADMGKVMGIASKQLAGKADGSAIARVVKEKLSH